MKILKTPKELQEWRRTQTGSVGFVPTMGALHVGHGKLIENSVKENNSTVLSIFVNPTQFNDTKDFEKYPQTFDQDIALANSLNVDAVFCPVREMLYQDNYRYRITEHSFSHQLCGNHRPGHFDGVLTVVMKLFQIVKPARAYFGEKDAQQLELIRGMVDAFFLDIKVVSVPTVREASGLALSSRNKRLTTEELAKAPLLYKTLISSKTPNAAISILKNNGFKVDYVEDHQGRRYAAAFLGETRLIDNVEIENVKAQHEL